ncbi:MAG TPA: LptF/LptG family permease, partial [Saprospiraceae bacterium]|nr:LptF/LptG family permease [Saprospiraceae bacterium]
GLSNQISGYFSFMKPDSAFINLPDSEEEDEPADAQAAQNAVASAPASDTTTTPAEDTTRATASLAADSTQATADTSKPKKLILTSDRAIAEYNKRKAEQPPAKIYEGKPLEQVRDKPLEQDTSFVQLFKKADQRRLFNKAKSVARSIHAHSESAERSLDRLLETRVKFIYELHTKYSMALVCFIFVLIGGPMGAIVRKGGFGYPILIAIIFFMLFIVLTIFCRKIAESFVLPAAMAAWIPCGLLFPIGLLLTIKAMNDSKVLNPDRLVSFFSKLFKRRAA